MKQLKSEFISVSFIPSNKGNHMKAGPTRREVLNSAIQIPALLCRFPVSQSLKELIPNSRKSEFANSFPFPYWQKSRVLNVAIVPVKTRDSHKPSSYCPSETLCLHVLARSWDSGTHLETLGRRGKKKPYPTPRVSVQGKSSRKRLYSLARLL